MELDQLTGRYRRLKDELAVAYAQRPWPKGRIDRLAEDIAATEREISAHEPKVAPAASRAEAVRRTSPQVTRTRLTPFGAPVAEHAAE